MQAMLHSFRLPAGNVLAAPGGPPPSDSIAAGPNGSIWFTEPGSNAIGVVNSAGAFVRKFVLPTRNAVPLGITEGPGGTMWFSENARSQIVSITAAGKITEFPLPVGVSGPLSIVSGPDGNLWFTDNAGVASIDPQTGGVKPYTATSGFGIAVGPGCTSIWFVESIFSRLARVAPIPDTTGCRAAGSSQPAPTPVVSGASAPPPPVSGVSADLSRVTGTVFVNGKPLVNGSRIPFGATVDTTHGTVQLESVGPSGALQHAQFHGAIFVPRQAKGGVTKLLLKGGDFNLCSIKGTRRLAATAPNTKVVRSLWGSGKGRFATQGRYAAATVRGTIWNTQDRCDGTRIYVRRGIVSVLDLVTKKTIILKAGQSFLAKP